LTVKSQKIKIKPMKTTNLTTKTRGATLDQREELKLLRSFVIGITGNDPEGKY